MTLLTSPLLRVPRGIEIFLIKPGRRPWSNVSPVDEVALLSIQCRFAPASIEGE